MPIRGKLQIEQIILLEATVKDFLQKRLSSRDGIKFQGYNVTVIAQTLQSIVDDEQSNNTTSNHSTELVRVRLLEGQQSSLIVDTVVTAVGTPAELADDFPFQTVVHKVISINSEKLYDQLFSSGAFAPEQTLEIIELQSRGNVKSVALSSSIGATRG